MKDENKIIINSELELINDSEAFADVSQNPFYQWVKIVVCDSDPNANRQRIPDEEFDNLIRTGTSSPVKMAKSGVSGHQDAMGNPIGTITQLKKEGNKLLALAALWKNERPNDIAMLKDMYKKGTPPNVSWEVSFEDSEVIDGIENLKGCILNGLAVVKMPAYQGRTPFVAMSSVEMETVTQELGEKDVWTKPYIDSLPDESFLLVVDGNEAEAEVKQREFPCVDIENKISIPHVNNAIARINESDLDEDVKKQLLGKAEKLLQEANTNLEGNNLDMEELEKLQNDYNELKASFDAKATELETISKELETIKPEYETLKEFKSTIDAEKEKQERLASIKGKFEAAKLTKDETYFAEKQEELLKLSDEDLDFMLQEMVGFASNNSSASVKIPNLINRETRFSDVKELAKELRERKTNQSK